MPADTIQSLDALRDSLAEARRYVRRQPNVAYAIVVEVMGQLPGVLNGWDTNLAPRLTENLAAGVECMWAIPTVLEGYLDGAIGELAWVMGQVERGRGQCGNG